MEELDGTRGLVFESLRPDQPKHSLLFNLQGDPKRSAELSAMQAYLTSQIETSQGNPSLPRRRRCKRSREP